VCVCVVVGIKSSTLGLLGKYFTTELHPQLFQLPIVSRQAGCEGEFWSKKWCLIPCSHQLCDPGGQEPLALSLNEILHMEVFGR
jgi:hypothetical protein